MMVSGSVAAMSRQVVACVRYVCLSVRSLSLGKPLISIQRTLDGARHLRESGHVPVFVVEVSRRQTLCSRQITDHDIGHEY